MSIKINRRNFLRATGFLGATAAAGYLPMAHTMAAPQTAMSAAMGNLVSPVNINLSAEAQAARFLIQATLGANYELIQEVKDKGVESWLDEQFVSPLPSVKSLSFHGGSSLSAMIHGASPTIMIYY